MPKRTDIKTTLPIAGPRRSVVAAWCCRVLLFAVATSSGFACSTSATPTEIGRHFRVEVTNQGKAVEGLQIGLDTYPRGIEKSQTLSILRTNANGVAEFQKVHPGLYFIAIKHPAYGYSSVMRVMRHPPKGSAESVSFDWPGWKPLTAQSVSGLLNGHVGTDRGLAKDLAQPAYSPVQGAKITLSKFATNEALESQTTSVSGMFTFSAVPAGEYFLRIETPVSDSVRWLYPHDGYVPIMVDPSATFASLSLFLDDAICGELAYEQRPKE